MLSLINSIRYESDYLVMQLVLHLKVKYRLSEN